MALTEQVVIHWRGAVVESAGQLMLGAGEDGEGRQGREGELDGWCMGGTEILTNSWYMAAVSFFSRI